VGSKNSNLLSDADFTTEVLYLWLKRLTLRKFFPDAGRL